MTIILPAHRALTTKCTARSLNLVTRSVYNPWLARVDQSDRSQQQCTSYVTPSQRCHASLLGVFRPQQTRNYATETNKPVGRPKAHTGRTPAKRTRKTTTTTSTDASKSRPGPKTVAGKSRVGRKPKAAAAAKTTIKKVKKVKAKSKPKPKVKVKVKKAPSKNALNKARIAADKELKSTALIGQDPKKLPDSAWTVIFSEAHRLGQSLSETREATKKASETLRNLTGEQKEHYNHVANENRRKNDVAYKTWVSQHTPQRIREANSARDKLSRELRAKKLQAGKRSTLVKQYPHIKDDRLVKRPRTAFVLYSNERWASGDFNKMGLRESATLIGREWKALSATDKVKYEDLARTDVKRYVEEHTTVYGTAPSRMGSGTSKTSAAAGS